MRCQIFKEIKFKKKIKKGRKNDENYLQLVNNVLILKI